MSLHAIRTHRSRESNMELRPILSTLLRHKMAAGLIVLEIALTCAIICNAFFLVGQRLETMRLPSGITDEDRVLTLQLAGIGPQSNAEALTREDLQALRAIPGVESVTLTNQLPFDPRSSSNSNVALSAEQERPTLEAAQYMVREDFVRTLGLRVVAGRDFNADEYMDAEAAARQLSQPDQLRSPVIITEAMAARLFPGQPALGKSIYLGTIPLNIVGVVQTLTRPTRNDGELSYSMILPVRQVFNGENYVIRIADPSQAARIRKEASDALVRVAPNRIQLSDNPYAELHANFFRADRAMIGLLLIICTSLLLVTALGIIGLASFWVQQRTRQIGIRRALGATRRQILRYFQTENFLLTSIGIVLGMLLAQLLNQWLMSRYELPRLPLAYLPIGALALWLLGQIAVLPPARRAAAIAPAVATRST